MAAMPRIRDFADDFNPFTALLTVGGEGHITDPYPELARLRHISPVQEMDIQSHFGAPRHGTIGDHPCYTILGWKAVNQVLETPADFPNDVYETNLGITFGKTITAMDPPVHTKYRKLVQAAFTPKALQAYRSMFQAVIDRLMDEFVDRGRADLVQEFALHFPFQFIMDLMGMDLEQRPTFHKLAMAQMCVTFDHFHGTEASHILGEFLGEMVDQRRALKSDTDFVSLIANAEVDGERLPQDIVVSFFRQLMNAGGDTSYHGFSNMLTALMTHPEQLEMMRQDRGLIPKAIEESLRWNGPLTAINRGVAHDLELAGVKIPKGAYLHVSIGDANRDENEFPNPAAFDITRPPHRQVAFGFGPHICIGQHLARMELVMATNTLLDRLPKLRLDPDIPAPQIRGLTLRGAEHVHVRFD
jgi:cytochrome P450